MAYDLGEYDMAKGTFQEHGTFALALVAPLFDTATTTAATNTNTSTRKSHHFSLCPVHLSPPHV